MDLNGIRSRVTPDIDQNRDQRVDAAEIRAAITKLGEDPGFRQAREALARFKETGRLDAEFEAQIAAAGLSPASDEAKALRADFVAQLEETVGGLDRALIGLRELAAEVGATPEGSLPLMAPEFYERFGRLEAKVRDFLMKADWHADATADGVPTPDEVAAYADKLAKPLEDELERFTRATSIGPHRRRNPSANDEHLQGLRAKVADVRDVAAKATAALAEPAPGAGGVGVRRPNDR
jgi:hypothetical protein